MFRTLISLAFAVVLSGSSLAQSVAEPNRNGQGGYASNTSGRTMYPLNQNSQGGYANNFSSSGDANRNGQGGYANLFGPSLPLSPTVRPYPFVYSPPESTFVGEGIPSTEAGRRRGCSIFRSAIRFRPEL